MGTAIIWQHLHLHIKMLLPILLTLDIHRISNGSTSHGMSHSAFTYLLPSSQKWKTGTKTAAHNQYKHTKTEHAAKPPDIIYTRKRYHKGCFRLDDHHHPVKPNQNEHLRHPSSATLLPYPKHRPPALLTVPSVVPTLPATRTHMSGENMKTNRESSTRNSSNTTNHRPPSNSALRARIRRNTASRSSSGISTLRPR